LPILFSCALNRGAAATAPAAAATEPINSLLVIG
jgi:hypothetical protein